MKIRSVTVFDGSPVARTQGIATAGVAAQTIRARLVDAGFEVQTTRLALAPAYTWMSGLDTAQSVKAAQEIETRANDAGIDYVSLGPVARDFEHVNEIAKLPELIAKTKVVFASAPHRGNKWRQRMGIETHCARGQRNCSINRERFWKSALRGIGKLRAWNSVFSRCVCQVLQFLYSIRRKRFFLRARD